MNLEKEDKNEPVIIKTDRDAKDGQAKCPKCGATDIELNAKTGQLRCNFCRYEFDLEKVEGLKTDIHNLQGEVIASGASNRIDNAKEVKTYKCSSCGAEVVIDTSEAFQARCHWCRNTLSVNEQIQNGAIPDVVLPFKLTKIEAQKEIQEFVFKRKFYANPKFVQEFTTENIMGVYFPYMLVDVNSHAELKGYGEKLVRRYTRKRADHIETYYDADLFAVEREFDLAIHGLSVESSKDKLDKQNGSKTTNVIDAIMPFDVENCVKWNANYLKGYSSEKRDTNINDLRSLVEKEAKDISRFAANPTLKEYNRGVAWKQEKLDFKGIQWTSAYLPVWLYSYQEVKGNKKVLHYVAVNARTKETMGSVPIHMPKLIGVSCIIELASFFLTMFIDSDYSFLFLLAGFLYFFLIYSKYRNQDARHKYETETKTDMENLKSVDKYIQRRTGLSNAKINGANNTFVSGNTGFLNQLVENDEIMHQIKNTFDNEGK